MTGLLPRRKAAHLRAGHPVRTIIELANVHSAQVRNPAMTSLRSGVKKLR